MSGLYRMAHVLVLAGLLAVLAGCATTEITSSWKDPAYLGPPRKTMVIGMAKQSVNRRVFEDEFVSRLKARGTDAFASYTVLPDALESDHAAIAAVVQRQGADTLLISRLISQKTKRTYIPGTVDTMPGYYGRWSHYYGYGYEAMYTPGYVAEEDYAIVETNLYDVKGDKLLWTAASETAIKGSDQELIKSFIEVMVNAMAKQQVLR